MADALLLLVEDDDAIAVPLERALAREGYDVRRAISGDQAVSIHEDCDVDMVLLDLGLPDVDGLEVCRRIRERDRDIAILMLTGRGDELDRVVGLDVGADDYLTKPFGLAELLARIRAGLRRAGEQPQPPGHERALDVRRESRRVFVGAQELALTPKEFDLLAMLHAEVGHVQTREALMDQVWDENWFGSTKTLDVTLGRLRQKLEQAEAPARVVSVRGVGFRLEVDTGDA